jgi:hypothetical protein
MPTPEKSQVSLAGDPTRQQLDELDALMQRMLALPVNPPDEAGASGPGRSETPVAQVPSQPATPVPSPAPSPGEVEETRAKRLTPPLENKPKPTTKKVGETTVPPAVVPSEPDRCAPLRTTLPPTKIRPADKYQPAKVLPEDLGPPVPFWLQPIVWPNRVFDGLTRWLGPPGRWLRGPYGRFLLACSGIVMLLTAVAWVTLHRMGWTW